MSESVATQLEVSAGELGKFAEDAISRGFSIITLEPQAKTPWNKYSPNACNSGDRNPETALRAWKEKQPANPGVSCGMSNLAVLDVDHGIESVEEFESWCKEFNIPRSFTVVSGRKGFGCHVYFTGAVKSCSFTLGKATGEIKSLGGYVVYAGAVHPDTGNQYKILHDVDLIPLPAGLETMAKDKGKTPLDINKTMAENGGKIPGGARNAHWTSLAGKLLNMGFDEEGIYESLIRVSKLHFDDGENYAVENDAKARDIAHRANSQWDATAPGPVVYSGDGMGKVSSVTKDIDPEAMEGDWLSELGHLTTDNTWIPMSFASSVAQTILSESLDQMIGYPGFKNMHLRNYNILLSPSPESGKGQSWERVGVKALGLYRIKTDMKHPLYGMFSSGEHLVKHLSKPDFNGKKNLTMFDEGRFLFQKGGSPGSTLLTVCTQLYELGEASAGSLTHSGGEVHNTSLSMILPFPLTVWNSTLAGAGTCGDGFLSRCVITYGKRGAKVGLFGEMDIAKVNEVSAKMFARYQYIANEVATKNSGNPIVPTETEGAKLLRESFEQELKATELKLRDENPNVDYASRLFSHFLREVLIRAIFSGDAPDAPIVITEDNMKRAILWARYQLYLRQEFWPVDLGNIVERMEQNLRRALKRHEALTKAALQTACNVFRAGSGGMDTFNRAFGGMLKGGAIKVVGVTTKKTEVFGLTEDNMG